MNCDNASSLSVSLSSLAGFVAMGVVSLFPLSVRADARLLGTWAPSNTPITVPAGASLTISAAGSGYSGKATSSFTTPLPVNCSVDPSLELVHFAPLSTSRFNLNFTGLTSGSCAPVALDSVDVEITFAEDNTSFIACQNSGRCSSWLRIGPPPESISTKTIPASPTVVATKTAIAVTWESLAGASSYVIRLNGPTMLSRTVKKGNSVKFTGLKKGTYKVTLTGTFKDATGKIKNTKSTKAIKVSIVGTKAG